ncbi:aldehyde dehydrogenase (NADP(+)) [Algoriphagus machipongonensis]|uniref:NADP-dependent fatty aldehyde dehydrogenase n=1 Tax=Algoriphagus machipongonensis TaxID=388413 RepID=A3HVZ5_9BACT|nr:aldehyde dehydrogenase (NADP(+)) [Algoriphagus machipongonensis]EAZ82317.1 NADP-dependent fatty aldehyde dehydrogenase [Algoriphagus machipongonensis]
MNLDTIFSAAQEAFLSYKNLSGSKKADFLEKIAETLEENRKAIVLMACRESNLPEGRINGELGRTTGQIKLFANQVREGSWLEATIDPADPHRSPLPKSDIRRMLTPLGPVVVFGASNFPLAFSTAGGDTISALAAGCPVVYKGHPAHPDTSKFIGECISQAVEKSGLPAGVFTHVVGGVKMGQDLVKHPAAKAVGFTGSYGAGKSLFNIASDRDEPIPVYAEMGSVNPIFTFQERMTNELVPLAESFVGSLTLGSGQFCTNPGLIFVPRALAENFENAVSEAIKKAPDSPMLHEGIAESYYTALDNLKTRSELNWVKVPNAKHLINVSPALAEIKASDWIADDLFQQEVFGSFALMVVYENEAELLEVAKKLHGQLTITLWADKSELKSNEELINILEEKCGRLLFSGVPTGVEVGYAMQHGGPFPSTTDVRSTSVGAHAIKRFARPIAFQDMPEELLPEALKNGNPLGIMRQVNGKFTSEKI